MSKDSVDHLERAKTYIGKGEDYYRRAAEEIVAAKAENPTLGYREIGEVLGRHASWCQRLVTHFTSVADPQQPPFGGPEENEARYQRQTKQTLRDPERRRKALTELPDSELEQVRRDTAEVSIERSRAKRAETNTEPTVRELTDGENFDPSEHWADSRIVSADAAVAKLFARVEKYGLILGSMEPAEAYEFLTRMESRIGDVRAAVQERVNDEVMV